MNLYKRILSYIKPYLHVLFAALVCTMLAAAGNLYLPWIFRDMIDKVLSAKDAYMLNMISVSIVIIFFLRGIFLYGQNYLMSYVGQHVIIDIRGEVFRKLQRLSMSFYDKNKTGTIMSYVTNDVNALQGAMVDNTIELVTESIILVGSVCAMIYLEADPVYHSDIPGRSVFYEFLWEKNPQLRWDDPGSCGRYHFCFAGIGFFCQGGQVFCTGTV